MGREEKTRFSLSAGRRKQQICHIIYMKKAMGTISKLSTYMAPAQRAHQLHRMNVIWRLCHPFPLFTYTCFNSCEGCTMIRSQQEWYCNINCVHFFLFLCVDTSLEIFQHAIRQLLQQLDKSIKLNDMRLKSCHERRRKKKVCRCCTLELCCGTSFNIRLAWILYYIT